ncbi:MAG: class I SAM-dependent methyltransferase [Nitrospirae bacterium]|nr:MAG: class I SAM-dependent methyltransferase [Nitrospirota bacterium]
MEKGRTVKNDALLERIRVYWNEHIHDLEIARHPIGSREFFGELADYRFEKLDYLPRVVDFSAYKGKRILEVGCGVGIDLIRFAKHGAIVTGIDLAEVSIQLAKQYFAHEQVDGELLVMNGEALQFDDNTFDMVYAHGVLQYTADASQMIKEIHRVVKPGGEAIVMVYNRYSWLNLMSQLFGIALEHEDAPVLKKYSIKEFRVLLAPFARVRIIPERFPVKTRLHHGVKALLYNQIFVQCFNAVPKSITRPFGWHLMALATK